MVLVDYRDGSNELIPLLPDCVTSDLPAGDICIPGNGPDGEILVGIEVKKINDLLRSITTGRLAATQLPRMLDHYGESWLLTVGEYRAGNQGLEVRGYKGFWNRYRVGGKDVPYGYLEALLVELQVVGLHIKQVGSNQEAARWIRVCERWWSKDWEKHRGLKKFDKSAASSRGLMPDVDPDKLQVAKVISQLPGLGWERAWAAAERFGTIKAAVEATAGEWADVKGIGKVLARSTVRAIYGR